VREIMQDQSNGKFIVIEGPDGAGSSTQIEYLGTYLKEKGENVLVTKEPTNNLVGGLIRGALTGEWKIGEYGLQLLFCADREHHLDREINPTLAKGWNVLTDRYLASTVVFGSVSLERSERYSAKGYDHWWRLLMELNAPFRTPDLTIILDLPAQESLRRINRRSTQTELFEIESVLERVALGYERFAQEYKNVVVINAERKRQEIFEDIKKTIEERFYK